MKVTIDGYGLILPPCGIKSFIFSFLKALIKQPISEEKTYELVIPRFQHIDDLFDTRQVNIISSSANRSIKVCEVRIDSFLFRLLKIIKVNPHIIRRYALFYWSFFTFPQYIKRAKTDIIFHPYQVISDYKTEAKKYVVVHDIFHWVDMERYNTVQKYFYKKAKNACENCTKIITISAFSKKQIENSLRTTPNQIEICYEGVDEMYSHPQFDSQKEHELKTYYHLPTHYLFGLLSPRKFKKNIVGSVRVLDEILKTNPQSELKLVLLGGNIETNQEVKEYIQLNKLETRIVFIPLLQTSTDLLYLYKNAAFFIFLSFEEGFGLPPLEALCCGTLPIVSNTTSLGELYSPFIPTFDPSNCAVIADYILKLSENQKSQIISQAREKMTPLYNWDFVISKYLAILKP